MKSEFLNLARLRAQWRDLHQKGDQIGVDNILKRAGLDLQPLNPVPTSPFLKQKLKEFGREWESKIAEQAEIENAVFFCLPITIVVSELMRAHQRIEEMLNEPDPWGVLLFCEAESPAHVENGMWTGIYYFTILSHRKANELQLESLAGVKTVGSITIL